MSTDEREPHGWVFYIDGSFRKQRAGWGIHGYLYVNEPLKQGIGVNQLPTDRGYKQVTLTETVTPIRYFDAFGPTSHGDTNNVAEAEALVEVFKIIETYPNLPIVILGDSEYVLKGYDRGLTIWPKKNWLSSKGEPVKNQEIWKKLLGYKQQVQERKQDILFIKVAAHTGEVGNELADINAKTGSGGINQPVYYYAEVQRYHKPEVEVNPLFLKTRMLFNIGKTIVDPDDDVFYYQYQLGRSSSFGHKQGDSVEDRHDKSDLILGRRIADATFSVIRLDKPDVYLEKIKGFHRRAFNTDIIELAVARLDTAYRASVYSRIQRMDIDGIVVSKENDALLTAKDELITKTLNPPRLAWDSIDEFSSLQDLLLLFIKQTPAKGVTCIDVTDRFYYQEETKKKVNTKLLKEITSNTPFLEFKTNFKDNDVVIKLVLGIDIPARNMLARLADEQTRVSLVVVANGPLCYSFATVFQTIHGDAIFKSPYSQFVIPKKT